MPLEFFNDDEIARMRADIANTLPDTAYILRKTNTGGLYGGFGEGGTVGTITARLDRLSRQDSAGIIADAEVGRTFYQATMSYNDDVRDGDDLEVEGRVFRILQITPSQSVAITLRAVVAAKDEGN